MHRSKSDRDGDRHCPTRGASASQFFPRTSGRMRERAPATIAELYPDLGRILSYVAEQGARCLRSTLSYRRMAARLRGRIRMDAGNESNTTASVSCQSRALRAVRMVHPDCARNRNPRQDRRVGHVFLIKASVCGGGPCFPLKLGILGRRERHRRIPVTLCVLLPALLLCRRSLPGRLGRSEGSVLAGARASLNVDPCCGDGWPRGHDLVLLLGSGLLILDNFLDLGRGRVGLVDEAVWKTDGGDPSAAWRW